MLKRSESSERGQVLVIVAVGLIAMVAMVGLVIDGGYAWGQQRDTQNSADASAEAGAVVMAERLASVSHTDDDVWAAVEAAAVANGIEGGIDPTADCTGGAPDANKPGLCAYYTDVDGNRLLDGSGASIAVGSLGAIDPPSGAAGVEAIPRKHFNTFIMRVVGLSTLDATAPATAVAGYVDSSCAAELGCAVLPVTIPVAIVSCDGSGDAVLGAENYQKNTPDPYVIPLCKNSPGNVGWLDWTPPGGGKSEVAESIKHPNNPPIPVPSWQYITEPGNPNSGPIEDALRGWDGQIVLIPQFDVTCNTQPTGTEHDPNYGCPSGSVGGNGTNQWYHLPQFTAFQLCGGSPNPCSSYDHGSYVQGNNKAVCDTGNGATSCLVGRFVDFITDTTVTGNVGANSNTGLLGVQLIR